MTARSAANFALRTGTPQRNSLFEASGIRVDGPAALYLLPFPESEIAQKVRRLSLKQLEWARQLARSLSLEVSERDRLMGLRLFQVIAKQRSIEHFTQGECEVYAQGLVQARFEVDPALVQRLGPLVSWAVRTDILYPSEANLAVQDEWLKGFNEIFQTGDLESIELSKCGDNGLRFEDVSATSKVKGVQGPLVSIIVPAFRPEQGIVHAVQSLANQSWENIEIIVVDDGSGSDSEAIFSELPSIDPRVSVVHSAQNKGTYVARNLGIKSSSGAFITFHDVDDWAHPRKIEYQMRPLLRSEKVMASRSWAVRVHSDLRITFPGYQPLRVNASSLLFRREPVLAKLEKFDEVRKSADVEFLGRLQAVFPNAVEDLPDALPLSLVQLRRNSLSRADLRPGWQHWSRAFYRDLYEDWHREICLELSSPRLSLANARRIPVPEESWRPTPALESSISNFDFIFLGDWRAGKRHHPQVFQEMLTLAGSGLSVAISHAESPTPSSQKRERLHPTVRNLVRSGRVVFVHVSQDVRAKRVVVIDPDSLPHLVDVRLRVSKRVVLAPNRPKPGKDYASAEHAQLAFAHKPVWVARDAAGLAKVRSISQGSPTALAPPSYGWPVRRRGDLRSPVVGHHLPDRPERVPQAPLRVYAKGLDVRLLAGTSELERAARLDRRPSHWLSYAGLLVGRHDFLRELDVFLYAGRIDDLVRFAVREARAAGCIPMVGVPPGVGDGSVEGALTVLPREAASTIDCLMRDRDWLRDIRMQMYEAALEAAMDAVEFWSTV